MAAIYHSVQVIQCSKAKFISVTAAGVRQHHGWAQFGLAEV